jgi:hypothetical protein
MTLEMNSVGNNLLTNTPNSVLNSVGSGSTWAPWFLIGGIVLLLAVAYLFYTGQTRASDLVPGLAPPQADWRAIEKEERREAREERREAREERREERVAAKAGFGENWCFVGEDVTGRWCVKVPQSDACSPERLFSSRPGCELVPASPLPLGLINKGGAEMNPLLAASHTK